ncbi:hypothetical protein T492DRAFT_850733 [Pavlovales sp. CCMP2436]|nr:hypothetical protein T492DRAFT_850733 [Pavlovales sp. CCMP2436]
MSGWFYSSAPVRLHLQLTAKGAQPALHSWSSEDETADACAALSEATAAFRGEARARVRVRLWAEGAWSSSSSAASGPLQPLVLWLSRHADFAPALHSLKLDDAPLALGAALALPLLPGLHTLNLSGVGLSALPAELVRGAASLRRLVLRANRLTALPAEVGLLGSLQLLDVSQNSLTQLPAELGQCSCLAHLLLEDNSIARLLPTALTKLVGLQTLLLAYNPLETLPQLVPLSQYICKLCKLYYDVHECMSRQVM